jgi:PDZ domain/Aspartyl protease
MFTCVLLLGCLSSNCLGQQGALPITIPVQIISGLVYMQGEVNSSTPLNVILDSGSSVSIVSPPLAETLGLTSTHSTEATGIGEGSDQTIHFVDDCELKWGGPERQLSLSHQKIAVLPIDYVSAQVGKRVDAFFGSNLLLHYAVSVDYERQRVTFSLSNSGLSVGTAIPIQRMSDTPFIEASIEGTGGKRVTALFLLDSGTSGAMILNRKFLDAHPDLIASADFVESPAVTAVGGVIRSKRVRVKKVGLGPFLVSGVVATVPDVSAGILSNASIAGFIGAGILKRFTVTWDYAGKRMILSPNRTFGDHFETDASGLHLVSPGPQYQTVAIDSVLPGSPAAQAGLEPGDEILAVDKAYSLPLWKVADILRKAGTSVVLIVQRKTTTLQIKLSLRDPL